MKHLHQLITVLLFFSRLIGHAQAKSSVPYDSLLDPGQGYNTFLGKGARKGAVEITHDSKRDEQPSDNDPNSEEGLFDFEPPSGTMEGMNPEDYFAPMGDAEIDHKVDKASNGTSNDDNSDGEGETLTRRDIDLRDVHDECAGNLRIDTKLQTSYEQYLKALDISASATISGWGQSASMSGSYLDKSEFSDRTLVFTAKIEITKQSLGGYKYKFNENICKKKDFGTICGDRWITGFEEGGKMIARIVITTTEKSSSEDIKAEAEASLKFWGVSADISASMKKNMSELSKKCKVSVSIFYEGALGKLQKDPGKNGAITTSEAEDAFTQAKSLSDLFIRSACDHNYKYRALLDEWPTLSNFAERKIPDYAIAEEISYIVLQELAKLTEFFQMFLSIEDVDDEIKQDCKFEYLDKVAECKDWTTRVAKKPEKASELARKLLRKLAAFLRKYLPHVPKKPDEGWICGWGGERGRTGQKCRNMCCSALGWCGNTADHCANLVWGGACQSEYGKCYPRGARNNEGCGPNNGNRVCENGYCCNNDGRCTTSRTRETDPNHNWGYC